jgi:hypothetical protein
MAEDIHTHILLEPGAVCVLGPLVYGKRNRPDESDTEHRGGDTCEGDISQRQQQP